MNPYEDYTYDDQLVFNLDRFQYNPETKTLVINRKDIHLRWFAPDDIITIVGRHQDKRFHFESVEVSAIPQDAAITWYVSEDKEHKLVIVG